MDRTPQLMGRAIVATSLVVLLAIAGVLLHLWLRPPVRRVARPPRAPLLVNEPDGSIYDLTLKLDALEERLVNAEQRSKQEASEVGSLRRENERLKADLLALRGEVARLKRQIPPPRPSEAQPPPNNTPVNSPGSPPGPEPGGPPP